ncbi:hypothetical protein I4U23_004421 [Adineta vaga]|nr:hypothetical protein I4U23_004421 [Adineta vaga]
MTANQTVQSLTISARAQGCSEARVAATLGSQPLYTVGISPLDGRPFSTIYEGFQIGKEIANRRGDKRFLGYRVDRKSGYEWVTYEETERAATEIGSGLIQLRENYGQNTFIGIYAVNSFLFSQWLTTAIACHFQSMIYVPLYDTLGKDAIVHIKNQNQENTIYKTAHTKRIEILTYNQLLELGRSKSVEHHPPKPDDVFQICYTSGTTGLPKGVIFTQKNLIAIVRSATELFNPILNESETLISYLPLAHSYEQIVEHYCLCNGFKIGYYLGDILQLSDDLAHLQPTFMPSVPRLLKRMYDTIQGMVPQMQPMKTFLYDMVLKAKPNEVETYRAALDKIWGVMVNTRVQKSLGGRVKLMASGAAPVSPVVLQFLRHVSGIKILEGFGQTENCGVATCQQINDSTVRNIGVPLHCNMIKLVDVPDMQYFARDNVGELCIKGANVFKGYFRDEVKTREAIDNEGWLHTGDIAKWTPTGQAQIIDRKKHMFKLSQGEYIAPERIENIYIQSRYITQAFVFGNSYKNNTVAIIVPDPEVLLKYAAEKKSSVGLAELCKQAEIKKLIFDDIKQLENAQGLKGFEKVKDIYLHPELFSISNNLLTPTMKAKRPELAKYFERQIDHMYKNIA